MSTITLINEIHPELEALGFKLGDNVEAAVRLDQQAAYFENGSTDCVVYKPDFEEMPKVHQHNVHAPHPER